MKVEWSPLALERIKEIADYIKADSSIAAKNWVNSIFDRTDLLSSAPRSGRVVPELKNEEIREVIFGNHRIIYAVGAEVLSVLTVRHIRQILPIEEAPRPNK
ncbi:MAG: type II toxin-antitoxin system RelE/ParE family toxin [Gammaproteobacteria bacterium]|nr:type II toxin-antitoxin system RelE/ParE family toxin [Gammaproteobacteria bacterium]MDH5694844.1 type II toxin-antitoxin system RelE/ParE family toxin [Gammaproteobacteria bacterium]